MAEIGANFGVDSMYTHLILLTDYYTSIAFCHCDHMTVIELIDGPAVFRLV